jgi:UPF0042 nucleotide-binding protein
VKRKKNRPRVLIITGLSGSGKTQVSRALEDVGWFCVDNLPTALIPPFAELLQNSKAFHRSVLVVDIREPGFADSFPAALSAIQAGGGLDVSLLFVEAEEKILLRRFGETRRPHPLAVNEPAIEGIREERLMLASIRKRADLLLDTSHYNPHQLRDYIQAHYDVRAEDPGLFVTVMSFGYKYGVPGEADVVFDARFLPNPNFVPRLKRLTGKHPAIVRYLRRQKETREFLRRLHSFAAYMIPRCQKEGKAYLTIAIGCTGGRHRSVMIANALARSLARNAGTIKVRHRDLALQ